jgi:hypothetical protein
VSLASHLSRIRRAVRNCKLGLRLMSSKLAVSSTAETARTI